MASDEPSSVSPGSRRGGPRPGAGRHSKEGNGKGGGKNKTFHVFDVTISCAHAGNDHQVVGRKFSDLCTKFAFQKEEGGRTGYQHWQGRIRLRNSVSLEDFNAQIKPELWNCHCSVTTSQVALSGNVNYVLKEETRIEGPWNHDDFDLRFAPVMTRQLRAFMGLTLKPYQVHLLERLQTVNDRTVIFCRDKPGGAGKSIFSEFLEYRGWCTCLPPIQDHQDFMAAVNGRFVA